MSLIRRDVLQGGQRLLLVVLVVIGVAIFTLSVRALWNRDQEPPNTPSASPAPTLPEVLVPTAMPMMTLLPTKTPVTVVQGTATRAVRPIKVGIVAGHLESDSGAVCPDGLTEVEINVSVAQQVVSLLSLSGYAAEVLAEFSPKLNGYEADLLVSIHADSCNVPEASGFKVARVSSSLVPELEDRLVACLIDEYHEATGLEFHKNSITYDMTEYHAFYEIAPETPAAIIEIGFMGADRILLTRHQDRVARGIVNGIKCFVESIR